MSWWPSGSQVPLVKFLWAKISCRFLITFCGLKFCVGVSQTTWSVQISCVTGKVISSTIAADCMHVKVYACTYMEEKEIKLCLDGSDIGKTAV